MHRHSLLRTALLTLAALLASPAMAGNSPQAPQQPQQAAGASIEVTEEDVQNFAEAHQQVMQVRQQYVGKAKNTEDKQKMAELKLAMQKDMLKAVQESGMAPQRYNQVARQVAKDEALQQRVEEELQE